ncbi:MAG: hypothetical protein F3741_08775 [Nitrospinae bacterium]|nr:hypothetical protein [Nitrospinota bacterium]MZH45513.1 hypothetical protein [Nitrospinota bacterium]
MEALNHTCSCLNHLTPEQKKQADAVAGGDFEKLLIELQIIRSSFNTNRMENKSFQKSSLPEFKRPQDILNVFLSDEVQNRQAGDKPFFLEKKFPIFGPSVIKTMI